MCGFVVLINKNLNIDNCNSIFNSLSKINRHRGPDKINISLEDKIFVIFRRLKIIDLSNKSNQPFVSKNNKVKMVFNGEIYNFIELRKDLIKLGVKFKTNSDTEVLLESYLLYGTKFINKIRGMFSIVIFDKEKKKTFLFRDQFGQKPLYYSLIQGNLIISSEIKDIIFIKKAFKIEIKKNQKIIKQYLLRGWADDSTKTFYYGIFSFPAASMGIFDGHNFKIKKFWKLDIKRKNKFNSEEFRSYFNDNIKLHLRSDVPIAFTLSGGLDSSSIVRQSIDILEKNYKAFSLKLKDPSDENKLINLFVKKNRVIHEYYEPEKDYDSGIIQKLIKFQDEPSGSFSFVNQFLLRKKMKDRGFKVVIVGEGGDEVLGGYSRMFVPYLYNQYFKKNKIIPDYIVKNIGMVSGWKSNEIKNNLNLFLNKKKLKHDFEKKDIFHFTDIKIQDLKKDLTFYNKVLPNEDNCYKKFICNHLFKRDLPHILRQEDRVSMGNSMENRSPFIDHKFVEYVMSHDEKYFMKDGFNKFMLRSAMHRKLPNNLFYKKKIGRPGLFANLLFKYYSDIFYELIKKNKIPFINEKKVLRQFKLDLKTKNQNYVDLYFRFLSYLIWENA